MAVGGLFEFAKRAFFSKPTPERQLLRLAKSEPFRRVVELGVESIDTTTQVLRTLVQKARGEAVTYTAIDAFDEREDKEPLPLMDAYRTLIATGARIRLVPGRPASSLRAEANTLTDTDLLLLARGTVDASFESAWFYVPRMCHPGTQVLHCLEGETAEASNLWKPVPLDQVAGWACGPSIGRAA